MRNVCIGRDCKSEAHVLVKANLVLRDGRHSGATLKCGRFT
jgi:hypothetical protein